MNIKISILILIIAAFSACEQSLEITSTFTPATSNDLIVEEYKFGDTCGKFSIYGAAMSNNNRIGFYGIRGTTETAPYIVGELSPIGNILWYKDMSAAYSTARIIQAPNGYLFYGTIETGENSTVPFVYHITFTTQEVIEVPMPAFAGNTVNSIYHIEKLPDNNFLLYLGINSVDDVSVNRIYAVCSFSNQTFTVLKWFASNRGVNISSVNEIANGYEIIGACTFIDAPDDLKLAKINVLFGAENTVNFIWNTSLGKATTSNKYVQVQNDKIYICVKTGSQFSSVSSQAGSYLGCFDRNTGELLNKSTYTVGSQAHGRYYSIDPYRLVFNNNKLYLIGDLIDYYYIDNAATRGYGGVQVYDANGILQKAHLFGSDVVKSVLNDGFANGSQLFLFGGTDVKYNSDNPYNEWFIPYNGFSAWFFKVNLSDL
jgi:hypothetical protein